MTRGRPTKYSDDELKEILVQFAINHKGKINPLRLEKETGIKRHVWTRRMSDKIERLNSNPLSIETLSDDKIPIPSLSELVMGNIDNKTELIRILNSYDTLIQELTSKSIAHDNLQQQNRRLSDKLEETSNELEFIKKERDHYKSEYRKIAVESTYNHKREEKGIDNVVDMSKASSKKKATTTDWASNFPSLFSDD